MDYPIVQLVLQKCIEDPSSADLTEVPSAARWLLSHAKIPRTDKGAEGQFVENPNFEPAADEMYELYRHASSGNWDGARASAQRALKLIKGE